MASPFASEALLQTLVNNRFRLLEVLGESAQAVVYRAQEELKHKVLRTCAVRVMLEREVSFQAELLQLSHPALLAVESGGQVMSGEARGCPYLVSDLAEASLADRLPLSPGDVAEVAMAVASALAFLHEKGEVHLHVSPRNVLRVDGRWKLADAGLLPRHAGVALRACWDRSTLPYAAPDLLSGVAEAEADMFALGVLLRVCLGKSPETFPGAGPWIRYRLSSSGETAEPLPAPFDAIVPGCLLRDPSRRWTAAQVLAALEGRPALRVGAPVPDEIVFRPSLPPSTRSLTAPLAPGSRVMKERRLITVGEDLVWIGFAARLNLLLAVSSFSIQGWDSIDGSRRLKHDQRRTAWEGAALLESADATLLVLVGGDASLRLWNVESEEEIDRYPTPAPLASVTFGPGGAAVLGLQQDDRIGLWPPEAGTTPVADPQPGLWSLATSPDGRWLAGGTMTGQVRRWPLEGSGAEEILPGRHGGLVTAVAFATPERLVSASLDGTVLSHADGRVLEHPGPVTCVAALDDVLVTGCEDRSARVWTGAEAEPILLRGHKGPLIGVALHPEGRQAASIARDRTVRLWDGFR